MRQTGKTLAYGGQAVIEGVMMRGRHRVAVAVRNPQGRIVIHEEELNPAIYRGPISQVPFLRWLTMLWDALGIGTRALMWSAGVSLGDEKPAFEASPAMTAVSMSMSAGLVFVSPALASSGLARFLKLQDNVLTNIIEGLLRLGLVTGYIWAIGQMEQGKRLFQYHGAEHKT